MNKTACLFAATAFFALAACSSERVSHFPSYKLKVIQGNRLDARAVAALQPGMSRDQVQLLLGTPLLRNQPQRHHRPGRNAQSDRLV